MDKLKIVNEQLRLLVNACVDFNLTRETHVEEVDGNLHWVSYNEDKEEQRMDIAIPLEHFFDERSPTHIDDVIVDDPKNRECFETKYDVFYRVIGHNRWNVSGHSGHVYNEPFIGGSHRKEEIRLLVRNSIKNGLVNESDFITDAAGLRENVYLAQTDDYGVNLEMGISDYDLNVKQFTAMQVDRGSSTSIFELFDCSTLREAFDYNRNPHGFVFKYVSDIRELSKVSTSREYSKLISIIIETVSYSLRRYDCVLAPYGDELILSNGDEEFGRYKGFNPKQVASLLKDTTTPSELVGLLLSSELEQERFEKKLEELKTTYAEKELKKLYSVATKGKLLKLINKE